MGFAKDLLRTITNILGLTKPRWKEKKLYGGMEEFHKTQEELKKVISAENKNDQEAMKELLELEKQDIEDGEQEQ